MTAQKRSKLLSLRKSDNLQEEEEDLDNVHIKGEGSKHILLWADGVLPVPDEQLSMIGQKLIFKNTQMQRSDFRMERVNNVPMQIQSLPKKVKLNSICLIRHTRVNAMAPIPA